MASNKERLGLIGLAAVTGLGTVGAIKMTENQPSAPTQPSSSPATSGGDIDYDKMAQAFIKAMDAEKSATPTDPSAAPESPKPSASTEALVNAGAGYGEDAWSKDLSNWSTIEGVTNGVVMMPETKGLNSIINTDKSVAQAYWDVRVSGEHQAIALAIAPDLTLPVRGVSEYQLNGEDRNAALERAFQGAVAREAQTQPNVCTLEITNSVHAVKGNEQTEAQDMWEAEKLTPDQAAARFGRDEWSQNPANWESVDGGYGMKLKIPANGLTSVVAMDHAVGQAYLDGSFEKEATNDHQVMALTLAPGVVTPVREVTVYAGVPNGMETGAAANAFAKAVNLEINGRGDSTKAQEGVYVLLVSKSECPTEATKGGTSSVNPDTNTGSAQPSVEPSQTIDGTPWYNGIVSQLKTEEGDKFSANRFHPLTDGSNGYKIEYSKEAVKVTLVAGEVMDTPQGRITKPGTYSVTVATIYQPKQ